VTPVFGKDHAENKKLKRFKDISLWPVALRSFTRQRASNSALLTAGFLITPSMHFPILIVLHQEHSTPGRIGLALQRLGYPLDVRRPPLWPDPAGNHGGTFRSRDFRRSDERQ
jgi:hypothetical protein